MQCTHDQQNRPYYRLHTSLPSPRFFLFRCFVLAQWELCKCGPTQKLAQSWHTGRILMWAGGRIRSAVPQPACHFLSPLPSVSASHFCAHGGQWLCCALLLLSMNSPRTHSECLRVRSSVLGWRYGVIEKRHGLDVLQCGLSVKHTSFLGTTTSLNSSLAVFVLHLYMVKYLYAVA